MAETTNLDIATFDQDLFKMAATNSESQDEIEAQIFLLAKRLKRNKQTNEPEQDSKTSDNEDSDSESDENESEQIVKIDFYQDFPRQHDFGGNSYEHPRNLRFVFTLNIDIQKQTVGQLIDWINDVKYKLVF